MTAAPSMQRGPLVFRRRLGARLKALREQANVRLSVASSRIECSTSKLSRLENGQGIPRAIEVIALLDLYQVDDSEESARLLTWVNQAKATTWWEPFADVSETLALYLSLEAEARLIRTFSNGPPSGLVQTRDYARAATELYVSKEVATIERLVEIRMARQQVLERDYAAPLRLEHIITEEALYRPVADRRVMRAQLEKLLVASEAQNIAIAVLPLDSPGRTPGPIFSIFIPLDSADWEVVNEEGNIMNQWFETSEQVQRFKLLWDDFSRRATDAQASRELISEALRKKY